MKKRKIQHQDVEKFKLALCLDEKSKGTIAKYGHDVKEMLLWLAEQAEAARQDGKPAAQNAVSVDSAMISRQNVLSYKEYLKKTKKSKTVNSYIAAINRFFDYLQRPELQVSALKIQRPMFWDESRVLIREEYMRLLDAALEKKNFRLYMLMQAICSTGIRISELQYITLEAAISGRAEIDCKGKIRTIILPRKLCKSLKKYARKMQIEGGSLFVTRSGNPLDRSNVCRDMKSLCELAGVDPRKVHPHSLRHLFARAFYQDTKDIVKLADILGHSSIETTRIYTLSPVSEEDKRIDRLGFVV